MSKHIVLTWELGAALGHVMGFRNLVIAFLAKDYKVSIVGRNLPSVDLVFHDLDISYYQSPLFSAPKMQSLAATHSYSDIIYDLGYSSEQSLTGLVNGWLNLFQLLKPDLLICDHSPSALVAAACLNIRAATFGNGFFVPPDSDYPVLFQDVDKVTSKQVFARYKRVLQSINKVLSLHKAKPISRLYDVFRPATHFLCTFAETDHYERSSDTIYYGPRSSTDQGRKFSFSTNEKVVFVYLQAYTPQIIPLIKALAKLTIRSILYIPNAAEDIQTRVKQHTNITLSHEAVHIDSMFEHTALLVSNGSHGLVSEGLLRAIPSLLLPTQLEQNILAKKLSTQKLALAMNDKTKVNIDAALQFALTNNTLHERLAQFKQKYADYKQADSITKIVNGCIANNT